MYEKAPPKKALEWNFSQALSFCMDNGVGKPDKAGEKKKPWTSTQLANKLSLDPNGSSVRQWKRGGGIEPDNLEALVRVLFNEESEGETWEALLRYCLDFNKSPAPSPKHNLNLGDTLDLDDIEEAIREQKAKKFTNKNSTKNSKQPSQPPTKKSPEKLFWFLVAYVATLYLILPHFSSPDSLHQFTAWLMIGVAVVSGVSYLIAKIYKSPQFSIKNFLIAFIGSLCLAGYQLFTLNLPKIDSQMVEAAKLFSVVFISPLILVVVYYCVHQLMLVINPKETGWASNSFQFLDSHKPKIDGLLEISVLRIFLAASPAILALGYFPQYFRFLNL